MGVLSPSFLPRVRLYAAPLLGSAGPMDEKTVDFHACRVFYISLVVESGVTVKEAQELARHASPDLTMNVYARTRPERISAAVERIGDALISPKRVPEEYRQAIGAETKNATPVFTESCVSKEMVELRGIEPLTS